MSLLKLKRLKRCAERELAKEAAGTYAAVWLTRGSAFALHKYYKDKGIPGLKDADSYHITTTYSRVVLPDLKNRLVKLTLDPAHFEYMKFGDQYLVLAVKHPALTKLFNIAKKMGATWDFPSYTPHITLSETFKGPIKDLPPVPTFDIQTDRYMVEPLDENA